MIPFTGRSKDTTLVKNKPTPVGFKVWVIAQNGLFIRWLWHVKASPYTAVIVELPKKKPAAKPQQGKKGKGRPKETVALSNTAGVVIHLVNMLPKQTYHVFMDNLFSSPNLFRALREAGHRATGTARPNCGITKELKLAKGKDKAGASGFKYNEVKSIPTIDGLVVQIAWKDNSLVLFLSTVYSGADDQRTPKRRKKLANTGAQSKPIQETFGDAVIKVIPIPIVSASHNDEMNHVDRGDQIRSYTSYEHRFRRGPWQALLWSFLLDVALANSFILQLKTSQPRWPPYKTLESWKKFISDALFVKFGQESGARKRSRSGKEEDMNDTQSRQNHLQRDINHPSSRLLDVSLKGAINTSSLAFFYLRQQCKGGALSSLGQQPVCSVFELSTMATTAKHGVLGFGRALIPRLAAAQLSIRVNTLSPSWTDTNLVPCVKNLLSDINVEVQPASAVARCAAYLMADTSRNGQLIYVQHGKYAEVDSILLGKYSAINGRFPSKDDVLRLLEETAVSG
ncbi:hypothetical protein FOVG_17171 [Fusarium oxysporum f. sp. pisi HDV247]|uniref:PiggyBac transposable element-derived protein domain-containing protein n=1 Tax=Fusarium oxysporum f. sp. pisi HDV247 TaxID=1080344 RepID=W9NUW3_FUSOX|nr:hypothetical protein FOVG_17171 [Fusarium oxysporum f. sp. pisi HDV247]